jgi:hypothetical protein
MVMCCGSLDPKHALREMDDRLKSVSWLTDTRDARSPTRGLSAWLRAVLARRVWKEASDV